MKSTVQTPIDIESLVANPFAGYPAPAPRADPLFELAKLGANELEKLLLQEEQADCPLVHRFAPGIYIREVTLPAGTLAIGHRHLTEHANILLKGRVLILNSDGTGSEVAAPFMYVSPPGRKVVYALEQVVWQNIYATTETDVEKLEAEFLDKSDSWIHDHELRQQAARLMHEVDRADYLDAIAQFGLNRAQAEAIAKNEDDQVRMPHGSYKFLIGSSAIHGRGVMATASIEEGEVIGAARIEGMRTPLGRYTNHAAKPNAVMVRGGEFIWLVATRAIAGCQGGQHGEEITIDYRRAFEAAGWTRSLLCQQ